MGEKKMAVLIGWLYYRGRLEGRNDEYTVIAFAFLEQLFSLINNLNEDIAYSN